MDADSGVVEPAARQRGEHPFLDSLAIFLLGAGASWSAGNIGPVVGDLHVEFGSSLTTIGLLSGTIFYAATVVGLLLAPRAAERLGLTRALALAAACGGVGNLIFAFSDTFAMAATGRVITGIQLGFVGGLAPVLARLTGGVGRVGLFGASFQLGIGFGLGVGSVLADSGVDWRVSFVVTAAVAFSAIPLVLREHIPTERRRPAKGFFAAAVRSTEVWRLALLFMAMFAVPLTLGAWFVHYVTVDGSIAPGVAGVLAFALFAVSGLMREAGGQFARRGVPQSVLTGFAPALATAGLVAIGFDVDVGVVAIAVLLMGAGFALPYATMMLEAQRLFPAEPARPTSLLTMLGTAAPIPIIPVLGGLLDNGDGDIAFIVMGLFVLIAGLLNIKPAGKPLSSR